VLGRSRDVRRTAGGSEPRWRYQKQLVRVAVEGDSEINPVLALLVLSDLKAGHPLNGAVAAAESWIQRVEPFGGIEKIRRAALRGTDGTNLQMFDEEIQQMAASLDDETKAQIDQLMDPDNPGYGEKS
jgi:hypothetical protein